MILREKKCLITAVNKKVLKLPEIFHDSNLIFPDFNYILHTEVIEA